VESHERAGYDEYKSSYGQQRAAGADAGEIRPTGVHHASRPAESASSFHDFSYS